MKIGRDIDITVVDVRGDKVRLGIVAPRSVDVHRKEIYEAIQRQNIASAGLQPGDVPAGLPKPQPVAVASAGSVALPAESIARLDASPLFVSWKDPVSGIESRILARRLTPAQRTMRPPGDAFSPDGRFMWFQCGVGTGEGWTLGLADLQEQTLHHFAERRFGDDAHAGSTWWQTDAAQFWFTDAAGTQRLDPHTRRVESIWPAGTGHSHCDPTGQYFAGDMSEPEGDGRRVVFFNRRTGRSVSIASALPRGGDVAPRPQFCMNGRYICYTTTALDRVDVAVVAVDALVAATA